MSIRSPLSRAKGHGSAKEGVHHWIMQRITAIANIPLTIFFIFAVISLVGKEIEEAQAFFQCILCAILMSLAVISNFYHAAIGLQVVIEDYVECKAKKIFFLLLTKLGLFGLGVASLLAIVKLHLA